MYSSYTQFCPDSNGVRLSKPLSSLLLLHCSTKRTTVQPHSLIHLRIPSLALPILLLPLHPIYFHYSLLVYHTFHCLNNSYKNTNTNKTNIWVIEWKKKWSNLSTHHYYFLLQSEPKRILNKQCLSSSVVGASISSRINFRSPMRRITSLRLTFPRSLMKAYIETRLE